MLVDGNMMSTGVAIVLAGAESLLMGVALDSEDVSSIVIDEAARTEWIRCCCVGR